MSDLSADVRKNCMILYIAAHCPVCQYALEVADDIHRRYPEVIVNVIDIETTTESIPDEVFATPTYILDGRIWSLGNPSDEKIRDAFG